MHQLLRAGLQARRAGGRELKVELVADAAAALAVAALRAHGDADPASVELDAATGALIAPPDVFRAVVAGGGDGPDHPLLAAGTAAIRGAAGPIAIESGGPVVEAWPGARTAALTVVGDDGRVRLVPVPARALEAAVLVLAGVDDDAPAPSGPPVTVPAGVVAAAVAGDTGATAGTPLRGLRDFRRVSAGDAGAVELVHTDDGPWRVVAAGADVELRPVSAAELRAAIAVIVAAAAQRS